MKKTLLSFAAVAAMLLVASCGNKSANTANDNAEEETKSEAPVEVTYENFNVEKYGLTIDVPQGMRRTDNPVMDNGACWTFVPEDANDFPIDATVQVSVNETYLGDFTKEKVKERFDEDTAEATEKKLGEMEYTYGIEAEYINEYHRVIYKGNMVADVTVAYTPKYAAKLGGDIRDHIFQSMKWN